MAITIPRKKKTDQEHTRQEAVRRIAALIGFDPEHLTVEYFKQQYRCSLKIDVRHITPEELEDREGKILASLRTYFPHLSQEMSRADLDGGTGITALEFTLGNTPLNKIVECLPAPGATKTK